MIEHSNYRQQLSSGKSGQWELDFLKSLWGSRNLKYFVYLQTYVLMLNVLQMEEPEKEG